MKKNSHFNMPGFNFMKSKALSILVCISISFLSLSYTADVFAAKKKAEDKEKTKAPLIRKKTYDRLTKAQDQLQVKDYQGAIKTLDKIKGSRRLNSTELAQLWNFYAYIYFSQDLYPQAIEAYQTLLEQPNLQLGIKTSTLYTLSQLNFLMENYAQALARIQQWIDLSEKPSSDAFALLGQAYYKLEQFKKSIPALEQAIELRKSTGKKVKENWYLLLRANHYELKDYKSMAGVLTELITIYPKPQYFRDLAGAYSQLGDTKKQLGVMESMYEKGQLTKPSQVKNLANLFLIHEVPYKAAKIVDKAIKDGLLEKNEKNYALLSQAWVQAREDKRAIEPLTASAKLSDQGEPWIKLGRAYINLDQWPEAVKFLEKGLKKKGVKQPDSTYILLGMGYYNLKKLNKAKKAFEKAAEIGKNKRNKKAARQWIKYLDTEIKREVALTKN